MFSHTFYPNVPIFLHKHICHICDNLQLFMLPSLPSFQWQKSICFQFPFVWFYILFTVNDKGWLRHGSRRIEGTTDTLNWMIDMTVKRKACELWMLRKVSPKVTQMLQLRFDFSQLSDWTNFDWPIPSPIRKILIWYWPNPISSSAMLPSLAWFIMLNLDRAFSAPNSM